MNEQKQNPDNDVVSRLAVILGVIGAFFFGLIVKGAFRKSTWTKNAIRFWLFYPPYISLFVFSRSWDIPRILDTCSWIFPKGLGEWVYFHINPRAQLVLLTVVPFLVWLSFKGAWAMIKASRFQKAIEHLGIKTASNSKPTVIDVLRLGEHQKKILVKAVGIDVQEFKNKKGALESGFNAIIENICVSERNRQVFEIVVAEKALPQLVPYGRSATRYLAQPYSFLVGESLGGFLVASLLEIHHMIVAGSTGGGKSYFFKQVLVGLLESSRRIQFYLIDLKHGVEMRAFGSLDNVRVAKEAPEAVMMLKAIVAEMESRFRYLEEKGFTEIVPERDKKDRIVIGIDEASVLFTVERSSRSTKASAESARDLTDRIAKLGRAAGIHLVLATQKVVKETIDTRVQTNINARMVFRVNTVASSMTVLGNKLAAELPEIKGRGIWSVGSKDIVVQTPRLSPEEVTGRLEELTDKFGGDAPANFGPMLNVSGEKVESKSVFEVAGAGAVPMPTTERNP